MKQQYRSYLLDDDNRIVKAQDIQAESDADAIEQARVFANGSDFELWERARLVGRFLRDT